ncbi:MAG: hypothetical protein HYS23_08155 [Geobacter sp.]|nr:hypothetical protein [Geobacter sp.]
MQQSVLGVEGEKQVGIERSMAIRVWVRWASLLIMAASVLLGGCAVNRQAVSTEDYVEIDNPFYDPVTNDSPKIWVPRSYVEKGVPRGKKLLKKGYEQVAGTTQAPSSDQGLALQRKSYRLRLRLAVFEPGGPALGARLQQLLSRGNIIRPYVKPVSSVSESDRQRLAYLGALDAQPGGGPALVLAAPEGTGPGSRIKADLYDIRGPVLIRSFTLTVPPAAKDETREDAERKTLGGLTDAVLSSLEWFTWYGRVVNVSGGRVYVDAGAETGLKTGQRLTVYRGGETVKGIGFAPGERVASITVAALVGPDGAYAETSDAAIIKPGDFVELEINPDVDHTKEDNK